jgi:hypothetical protein
MEITDDKYKRLTPAAIEALKAAIEEYERSILEKAITQAKERNIDDKEISLRDILEAKDSKRYLESGQDQISISRTERTKRLYLLISMSGAVYAVIGILLYLYQNSKFTLERDLGLIVAAVGILLTLISFFYSQIVNRKPTYLKSERDIDSLHESEFEIVKRWHLVERITNELMKKKTGDNSTKKNRSFREIIDFLNDSEILDDFDKITLKELLNKRNQVVHGQARFSYKEILEYLKTADKLIDKIEKSK